ncbi:unnamed protein product [Lepidochelys olivacea]
MGRPYPVSASPGPHRRSGSVGLSPGGTALLQHGWGWVGLGFVSFLRAPRLSYSLGLPAQCREGTAETQQTLLLSYAAKRLQRVSFSSRVAILRRVEFAVKLQWPEHLRQGGKRCGTEDIQLEHCTERFPTSLCLCFWNTR